MNKEAWLKPTVKDLREWDCHKVADLLLEEEENE